MIERNEHLQELPNGWVWTRLRNIADVNLKLPCSLRDDIEVTFLPMKAVEEATGKYDASVTRPYGKVKKGYTSFVNKDIIFAKITPCMENGKVAVVDNLKNGVGFGSTEFHVIRLTLGEIPRKFLFYYLIQEGYRRDAKREMTGSAGQLRVPAGYLGNTVLPFPPLNEQVRVVARLEELFARLDAGVEGLRKVKAQLKRYRQAVLKYAFEGKLTEEWRKTHKNQIQPLSMNSTVTQGSSVASDLPEKWVSLTIPDIVAKQRNSIKRGPFGSSIKKEYFAPSGYKIYEQKNVIYNDFNLGTYFISEDKFHQMEDFELKSGDILITCSGTIGKIAIAPQNLERGIINQALLKLTLDKTRVSSKYFLYLFTSKMLGIISDASRGSAMKNISSVKDLKQIPFPLPPLLEQQKIVEEIEYRLSLADALDSVTAQTIDRADRLRQSILSIAFQGKLVPQDPSDEPADKLLERIREERANSKGEKGINKKIQPKQLELSTYVK